jgi:hypothetical protein
LYILGKFKTFDNEILSAIVSNNFIDTKNLAYDYEISNDFTWDSKDLVEIKKKIKHKNIIVKPYPNIL